MRRLVFLLEEASMKEFLEAFLPRVAPGLNFICIKHEGKNDLEKSIPRKLKAWSGVDFMVIRDNDGADAARGNRLKKQRNPDRTGNPSRLITGLIPEFKKVDGARRMGSIMPIDETANKSRSFQVFVRGLRKWISATCSTNIAAEE